MVKQKFSERKELLWRILIGIVTGIILSIWRFLICIVAIFHFFYVLFTEKRNKDLADFSEAFNGELYRYARYMTFNSNERPFPFKDFKRIGKFEKD